MEIKPYSSSSLSDKDERVRLINLDPQAMEIWDGVHGHNIDATGLPAWGPEHKKVDRFFWEQDLFGLMQLTLRFLTSFNIKYLGEKVNSWPAVKDSATLKGWKAWQNHNIK